MSDTDPIEPPDDGTPGNDQLGDEYPNEPAAPKFERAVDYMETDKGHEITSRFVSMLEQHSPAVSSLLTAKIDSYRRAPTLDFWKWTILLVVRVFVFVLAIVALIYMRRSGTVDPAIVVLIGGLVAYFFGYNRSQS